MSVDLVDDLEAAEEFAEELRLEARRVVDAYQQGDLAGAVNALDHASRDRFVRPSCVGGEHEDDCGAYHPPGGDGRYEEEGG